MNVWREWHAGQELQHPPQDHVTTQWDMRGAGNGHSKGRVGASQSWPVENSFGVPNHMSTSGVPERNVHHRDGAVDVSAMSDEQLYALVASIKQPSGPSLSTPAGSQARQPPYSVEDAKQAIRTAKASIGSKTSSKADQGNDSGSEEDDKSESYAGKSKRVLANRQSAHRSRLRKLQYIQDLENNVNRIQTEISQIQPQLTFLREKYSDLAGQNHKLREKVTSLLNEARYKESVNSTLRDEVKHMLGDTGGANHPSEEQANIFALQQPTAVNYAAPLN